MDGTLLAGATVVMLIRKFAQADRIRLLGRRSTAKRRVWERTLGAVKTSQRADTAPVVSLQHLSKVYQPTPGWMRALVRTTIRRDIRALQDVSLDVHSGEILAVVGPNGAGKTTMFKTIIGLTTPSAGSVTVLGRDAHHDSHAVRRQVGWMPADSRSLFLRLSCRENLWFHGRLHGIPTQALSRRIEQVLEQVGLGDRQRNAAHSLSSGMRARLLLARAILHTPRLVILDEPTGAVDPIAAHDLLGLITSLVREEGLAALISSHRLEEIEALRSHVVLLDGGMVRYHGDLDTLRAGWSRPQVEITSDTQQAAARVLSLLQSYGPAETLADCVVRYSLAADETVGSVLHLLGPLTASITSVVEARLPLRDMLARIYSNEADTAEHAAR